MVDALQFEFMRNALCAGVLVSIACGIVGTFVVLNRMVFISAGIAHAAYGGIGMAFFHSRQRGIRVPSLRAPPRFSDPPRRS